MKALMLLFMAVSSNPVATHIVNYIEPLSQANRDAYLAGPHTADRQQAALAFFDQNWAAFQSSTGCGATRLGSAGRKCIADKSRTGVWPWEQYYRDPIMNGHLCSTRFNTDLRAAQESASAFRSA